MDTITIVAEDGEEIVLYVLEQTRVNAVNYLLATDGDDEDEDGIAYILKDVSKESDEEAIYEFVEDEDELNALAKVFSELIDEGTELN